MAWGDFTNPEAWKQAMANLLRRGGEVGEYVATAPEKAGQAIIDARQRQSALMNEAFDPTGKTLIRNPQAANQAAMNLFEGPLSFAPAGITAWHGSPHTFEKFDMSKVGAGEGAQAYGHGMYFAESPSVAETYKTAGLSTKAPDRATEFIIRAKEATQNDQSAKQFLQKRLAEATDDVKPYLQKALENFDNFKSGNLYKVDIPDEHIPTMMDWDKPLGQQSAFVKKAINNLKKQVTPEMKMELGDDLNLLFGKDITPSQFLNTWEIIHPTGGTGIGEKLLNEQGVKGIRYLDNASRDAGKGTSNFVVFDPTDVKILERNNQPLKNSLESVVEPIKEKGIDLDIYQSKNNPNNLILSKIAVPKEQRSSGLGTEAMNNLIKFADSQGKTIALTPDTVYGATSKGRLKDFYKRFGFVENTGKNKDFSISEGMYRLPTKESRQDQLLKAFEQNNK